MIETMPRKQSEIPTTEKLARLGQYANPLVPEGYQAFEVRVLVRLEDVAKVKAMKPLERGEKLTS